LRQNKPKNTKQTLESLDARLNTFFKSNIYLLAFGMVGLNVLTMCSNSSFHEDALEQIDTHGALLKENLGKVHFLTATGQHVVGERFEVGYDDERFKLYLKNVVLDNLIQGLGEMTKGFTLKFINANDIKKNNERFSYFEDTFLPDGSTLLSLYRESLRQIIVEGRLPEYISFSDSVFKNYSVIKNKSEKGAPVSIEGIIKSKLMIKSWIKEVKKWDSREVVISIPFKAVIDVAKSANIGNPFGIIFTEIQIPTIVKPKASDVVAELKKKR